MTHDEYDWWITLAAMTRRLVDLLEASLLFESEVAVLKMLPYHPVTIEVDQQPIALRIKKMLLAEKERFQIQFEKYQMSTDGKTAAVAADLRVELAAWMEKIVMEYVSIAPGQVSLEDEEGNVVELRTGQQFLEQFGANGNAMALAFASVFNENCVDKDKQARFRAGVLNALNAASASVNPQAVNAAVDAIQHGPQDAAPSAETRVSEPRKRARKEVQPALDMQTAGTETS